MPRIRTLKPEAWGDRTIGSTSFSARLLWVVLITLADDAGRFPADPGAIWGHGYRYEPQHLESITGWLHELADADLIVLYTSGDEEYGYFPKWRSHQKIDRPSKSKFPEPPSSVRGSLDDTSTNARREPKSPAAVEFVEDSTNARRGLDVRTSDHGPRTVDHGPRESAGAQAAERGLDDPSADPLARIAAIDSGSPRFEAAWLQGDRDRVLAMASAESIEVQRLLADRLVDEAPRWQGNGVRYWIENKWLPGLRQDAERSASAPASTRAQRSAQRRQRASAGLFASTTTPVADYEAEAVEVPGDRS